MEKKMTCIACPRGCGLLIYTPPHRTATPGEEPTPAGTGGGDTIITGNRCPKGVDYALQELTNPVRILTSTVATTSPGGIRMPVKTSAEIPKDKMEEAMAVIHKTMMSRPGIPGDVIIEDFMGLKVTLVATGEWDGR
jgi:CxxC motif-containing protein